MAASYPSSIKSFGSDVQDNVDIVLAAHVNDLRAEVAAIETELGAAPKTIDDTVSPGASPASVAAYLDMLANIVKTITSAANWYSAAAAAAMGTGAANKVGVWSGTNTISSYTNLHYAANGDFGIGTPSPATRTHIAETETLTGAVTDGYSAGLTLAPGYTGAYAVTRHNYIDVNNVGVASGASVGNAALFRFDAGIGTHEALVEEFSTYDSNADETVWAGGIVINVNGTLYLIPIVFLT